MWEQEKTKIRKFRKGIIVVAEKGGRKSFKCSGLR